jgi:hypothetical protein
MDDHHKPANQGSARTSWVDSGGGIIYISGVDERKFVKAGGKRFSEYLKRFEELGIVDNLLAKEGDTHLVVPAKYYRWVPEEIFSQTPYVVYGDTYAIILWGPPVKIVLIRNLEIAASQRKQFLAHWRRGTMPETGEVA